LVDSKGKVIRQVKQRVGNKRKPADMIALIKRLIRSLKIPAKAKIIGVGCGVPGIVDVRTGTIGRSPHFPQWRNFRFSQRLSRALGLPVVADNDANMNAVGEHRWGAAKGLKNFVMLTLGTGIGGGIYIDGKIYHGDHGYAGEVGHIVIERDGIDCDCGGWGCWEEYAAASFFKMRGWGGKKVEKEAKAGDQEAKRLLKEYGRNLGIGINSLIHVLGITDFVIGGGLSRAAYLFLSATRSEIKRRAYPQNYARLKLRRSKLVDAAGVLGSAAAAFHEFS
jgi:predicted NBD/HSP70 family sugar kinase